MTDASWPERHGLQATRDGAAALEVLDERGTVEVGKLADLLILEADPLLDITHTKAIAKVVRRGVEVEPLEVGD